MARANKDSPGYLFFSFINDSTTAATAATAVDTPPEVASICKGIYLLPGRVKQKQNKRKKKNKRTKQFLETFLQLAYLTDDSLSTYY